MQFRTALELNAHANDTKLANLPLSRHGLNINIEHPKGTQRTLHNDAGKVVYSVHMHNHYGYIKKTKGRDGDDVDCFVGPIQNAKEVYVIHMIDKGPDVDQREDEDKCMIGFPTAEAAKRAFLLHYPKDFYGGMTSLPVAIFKKRLAQAQKPHREKKIHAGVVLQKGGRGETSSQSHSGVRVIRSMLTPGRVSIAARTLGLVICGVLLHAQQTPITGSFLTPDGIGINGRIQVSMNRPTIVNYCSTPVQTVAYRTTYRTITNGTLAALTLQATDCLVPQMTPTVKPQSAAGTGATASVGGGGTDLNASITLNTGAMPIAGAVVALTFGGGPYTPSPTCWVVPAAQNWLYQSSSTGLIFSTSQVLNPTAAYTIAYYCAVTPYTATLRDSSGNVLYMRHWVVPNVNTGVDASVLGVN